MDYIEFAAKLDKLPDISSSVGSLFERARTSSPSRFFLALTEFQRVEERGRNYRVSDRQYSWVLNQLGPYLEWVHRITMPGETRVDKELGCRLQMLAYSQFWECHSVQNLLCSLVKVAANQVNEPQPAQTRKQKTHDILESVRNGCKRLKLPLNQVLETLYRNQVRNAFSHSEYYIAADVIVFLNYRVTNPDHLPSLRLETWENLFSHFMQFVEAFFRLRHSAIEDLAGRLPFRVALPESPEAFYIDRHGGYWSFPPAT